MFTTWSSLCIWLNMVYNDNYFVKLKNLFSHWSKGYIDLVVQQECVCVSVCVCAQVLAFSQHCDRMKVAVTQTGSQTVEFSSVYHCTAFERNRYVSIQRQASSKHIYYQLIWIVLSSLHFNNVWAKIDLVWALTHQKVAAAHYISSQ